MTVNIWSTCHSGTVRGTHLLGELSLEETQVCENFMTGCRMMWARGSGDVTVWKGVEGDKDCARKQTLGICLRILLCLYIQRRPIKWHNTLCFHYWSGILIVKKTPAETRKVTEFHHNMKQAAAPGISPQSEGNRAIRMRTLCALLCWSWAALPSWVRAQRQSCPHGSHGFLARWAGIEEDESLQSFQAADTLVPLWLLCRKRIMGECGARTGSDGLCIVWLFKGTAWAEPWFPDLWSVRPVPDSII